MQDDIPWDTFYQVWPSSGGMMYVALGCAAIMLIEAAALALLLGKCRDRSLAIVPLVVAGCALLLAVACWYE